MALVTGGGSGLGRAIVDRFVEEGARVAVFDRSAAALGRLADAHGAEVLPIEGDVRSMADNEDAVSRTLERFGGLDCAVGNAGIWDHSIALDDMPAEAIDAAFDEMFQINVKGYVNLAKAGLPALVASRGSLILTVSNAGFDPAGGGVLYTASKHAVVGLIRQLAFEFAPAVRVNGVAPGPIATDLRGPEALGLGDRPIDASALIATAARHLPLGEVPPAAGYAGAYALLASRRDGGAATGGVISLDTGIAVRGIGRTAAGNGLVAKYGDGRAG